MAKKKGTSANAKARFLAYKTSGQAAKNAAKRLARHLKKHPNDLQSKNQVVPNQNKNGLYEATK